MRLRGIVALRIIVAAWALMCCGVRRSSVIAALRVISAVLRLGRSIRRSGLVLEVQ